MKIILLAALAVALSGQSLPLGGIPIGVGGGACTVQADNYASGTTAESTLNGAGQLGYAGTFTAGSSYTLCALNLSLAKVGSPTIDLTVQIFSDATNAPGTLIGTGSGTVAASSLGTTQANVNFTGLSVSIVSGTKYWIVLKGSADGTGANYVRLYIASGSDTIYSSADGSTGWSSYDTFRRLRFTTFHA